MKQIAKLPLGLIFVLVGWVASIGAVQFAHPYRVGLLVYISYIGFGGGALLSLFGFALALDGKRKWPLVITDLLALILLAALWFIALVQLEASHPFNFQP